MIEYKGYFAEIEFDDSVDIFHGEIINMRDVVTFEGKTVDELRQAFRDSVDDYLEFCTRRAGDTH
ncbi:MAG: type II toxin-antitoxin system HicB family antitoxin [Thermodesulfobacteriota bacterium]